MFFVTKEFSFDAAHFLPNHKGLCKNLHGHTYKVAVTFCGEALVQVGSPDEAMLVDFGVIDDTMKPLIAEMDHKCLNDVLGDWNPTAEALAYLIFQSITVNHDNVKLYSVKVWESPKCSAEFRNPEI